MTKKILILGLPKAGKTVLATELKKHIRAVHFNADEVRANINKDLGFSREDRIEQARRMGWLCDRVTETGQYAVADFVCPTAETRKAFGDAYTVYLKTGQPTPYADTEAMFEEPKHVDYLVIEQNAVFHAAQIAKLLQAPGQGFDWRRPTALFVGRYQPFHDGHKALIIEGIERVGQACIAVRDAENTNAKNPFGFSFIRARIEEMLGEYMDQITVVSIPNITNIFYGRDVGYSIERIDLTPELQAISATGIRRAMGIA
ncbi:MAG: adenylyl-sulfate kinase [Alphaproteobacteria bacterium]|nr:adenylyl-sulfate kinase [Alphaproteobacteria bacterium]